MNRQPGYELNYRFGPPERRTFGRDDVAVIGLHTVFEQLALHNVAFEGMVLKPNMIVPGAVDTVVVPVVATFPALTSSVTVGRVAVADGATLSIGAFDLTATVGVVTGPTVGSGVLGTTGRVILSGNTIFLGGTSMLIVVGVSLDTVRQLESQLMMRVTHANAAVRMPPRTTSRTKRPTRSSSPGRSRSAPSSTSRSSA